MGKQILKNVDCEEELVCCLMVENEVIVGCNLSIIYVQGGLGNNMNVFLCGLLAFCQSSL